MFLTTGVEDFDIIFKDSAIDLTRQSAIFVLLHIMQRRKHKAITYEVKILYDGCSGAGIILVSFSPNLTGGKLS